MTIKTAKTGAYEVRELTTFETVFERQAVAMVVTCQNITQKVERPESEERMMIRVLRTALEGSMRTNPTPPPLAQQQTVHSLQGPR